MNYTTHKTTCPKCKREVGLLKDGKIAKHKSKKYGKDHTRCSGSKTHGV